MDDLNFWQAFAAADLSADIESEDEQRRDRQLVKHHMKGRTEAEVDATVLTAMEGGASTFDAIRKKAKVAEVVLSDVLVRIMCELKLVKTTTRADAADVDEAVDSRRYRLTEKYWRKKHEHGNGQERVGLNDREAA